MINPASSCRRGNSVGIAMGPMLLQEARAVRRYRAEPMRELRKTIAAVTVRRKRSWPRLSNRLLIDEHRRSRPAPDFA